MGSAVLFQRVLIVCAVIAVFSIFLPLVHFNLPVVGEQSVSMIGMMSGHSGSAGQSQPQTKGQSAQMPKMKMDLSGMKEMANNPNNAEILKEKPEYKFIPVGLTAGLIAHILLIPVLVLVLLRQYIAALITAVVTFVLSLCFVRSVSLLNDMFHYAVEKATKGMGDSPFAGLANMFNQIKETSVTSGPAIFVVLIMMALIAAGCLLRNQIRDNA